VSEEQLSALLAKLKADALLRDRLKNASDLESASMIARSAGFDVTKEDWFMRDSKFMNSIGDQELELLAGGADKHSLDSQCIVFPSCGGRRCA
jgi:predicted ribosomally synthesized peptide with nif11-like leader